MATATTNLSAIKTVGDVVARARRSSTKFIKACRARDAELALSVIKGHVAVPMEIIDPGRKAAVN